MVVMHSGRTWSGSQRHRDLLVLGSLLGPQQKDLSLQPGQSCNTLAQALLSITRRQVGVGISPVGDLP